MVTNSITVGEQLTAEKLEVTIVERPPRIPGSE
jgi:hypothetical protein